MINSFYPPEIHCFSDTKTGGIISSSAQVNSPQIHDSRYTGRGGCRRKVAGARQFHLLEVTLKDFHSRHPPMCPVAPVTSARRLFMKKLCAVDDFDIVLSL